MARENVIGEVLNRLDNYVATSVLNKQQAKLKQDANTMNALLRMEMENQNLYRQQITNNRLTLPDEFLTSGGEDLVGLAGNNDRTTGMNNVAQNIFSKTASMKQAIDDYHAGQDLYTQLRGEGSYASPGEDPYTLGAYTLGPKEIKAFTSGDSPILTPEQATNLNFMRGMNPSQAEAMNFIKADIMNDKLAIEVSELKYGADVAAIERSKVLLSNISSSLGINMSTRLGSTKNGINIGSLDFDTGDADADAETRSGLLNNMIDKISDYGPISSDVYAALEWYISPKDPAYGKYYGLAKLGATIYDDLSAQQSYEFARVKDGTIDGIVHPELLDDGITPNPLAGQLIDSELNELREDSKYNRDGEYNKITERIESYQKLGLIFDEASLEKYKTLIDQEGIVDEKVIDLYEATANIDFELAKGEIHPASSQSHWDTQIQDARNILYNQQNGGLGGPADIDDAFGLLLPDVTSEMQNIITQENKIDESRNTYDTALSNLRNLLPVGTLPLDIGWGDKKIPTEQDMEILHQRIQNHVRNLTEEGSQTGMDWSPVVGGTSWYEAPYRTKQEAAENVGGIATTILNKWNAFKNTVNQLKGNIDVLDSLNLIIPNVNTQDTLTPEALDSIDWDNYPDATIYDGAGDMGY